MKQTQPLALCTSDFLKTKAVEKKPSEVIVGFFLFFEV